MRYRTLTVLGVSGTFLLSTLASAAPPAFDGRYVFSGRTSLIQVQEVHAANTLTPEGKTHFYQLLQKSFTCEPKGGSWYRCYLARPDLKQIPSSIVNQLRNRHLGKLSISFLQTSGTPELITDGEWLQEWMIHQRVSYLGKTWENYRYLESQGVRQLAFGPSGAETAPGLIFQETPGRKRQFGFGESVPVQLPESLPGREAWLSYFVMLGLD